MDFPLASTGMLFCYFSADSQMIDWESACSYFAKGFVVD